MTYIVFPQSGYYKIFQKDISGDNDVKIIPAMFFPRSSVLKRIIRKRIEQFLPIVNPLTKKKILYPLTWFYNRNFIEQLSNVEQNSKVLILQSTPSTIKMVRRLIPHSASLYCHFINTVSGDATCTIRDIQKLQAMNINISTFDPQDAKDYGIEFLGQFYFQPSEADVAEAKSVQDFFFCGGPKDRERTVLDLVKLLEKGGLHGKCVIPHSQDEFLSVEEIINEIKRSKCIIDINQIGQAGITRRPLEALFYKKKLITNNKFIKDLTFYRPENIFIIGEDDINKIVDFVLAPFVEVPKSITYSYTLKGWLDCI